MYKLESEINKREKNSCWSEEIATKVISERSRRRKVKITVTGSLFMVFFMFFVIGFNFIKTEPSSPSWSETIIASVDEAFYPQAIPQYIDEFISYSFDGR
ncbi:MAG: hypothetical protein P8Z50_00320 [candidate division WOR-3 bacterium]